jgi:formate dehydrogenase subunit delta
MHQATEKIVMMANQIAKNMAVRGEEKAIPAVADHIKKFWDPRMRATAAKVLDAGGKGLTPIAKAALEIAAERKAS